MTLKTHLLALARGYAAARGLSLARVSTLVRNDGKFFDRLEGGADCTTGVYEQAVAWFEAHWPEGAARPEFRPAALRFLPPDRGRGQAAAAPEEVSGGRFGPADAEDALAAG